MGFLLAVIAVIIIIITGGNHPSTVAKPQAPEPVAVVRPAPAPEPQQAMPETLDDKAMPANELDEQRVALEVDETEQKAPIGPNPCVGQDGGMIPDCAVIVRKTGEYELTKQIHVINDWVHAWTR